jgi:tetratricopeptide (TPR) repeat protein
LSEAEPDLLHALNLVRLLPDPSICPESGIVYYNLGLVYSEVGRFADAQAVMIEGLARPDLRPKWLQDALSMNLGWLDWTLGAYAEAERHARSVLEHETALPYFSSGVLDLLGMVRLAQGRPSEAVEYLLTAVLLYEDFQGPNSEFVIMLCELAEALLLAGRPDEAEQALARALVVLEKVPKPPHVTIYVSRALAGIALARGLLAEADRLLMEGEVACVDGVQGSIDCRPEILYRKAQLRRFQGRTQEADDLLEEACRLLDDRRESLHPRSGAMRAEWAGC